MTGSIDRFSLMTKVLFVLFLGMMLLSACDKLPFGEILFSQEEQIPVINAKTLFEDDFSDPSSGWDHMQSEGGLTNYKDGEYHIAVYEMTTDYFATAYKNIKDVHLEVDATKTSGTDDNNFGIICRYLNEKNFYLGQISSDGFLGIFKVKDGEYIQLGADFMQPSELINQGNATNQLRFDCVGKDLTLYVNGTKVMESQDTEFTSGDVGLLAGTFQTPGVHIAFDNFKAYEP